MTCQTCQFYRPDTCRRRSPSATGWPFVQPDDTCGEWEAAVAIPEAMQQLGETIGKMRDVVGVAGGWRNDRQPGSGDLSEDGTVWVWTNSIDGQPYSVEMSWEAMLRFGGILGKIPYWAPGNLPAPTTPPPGAELPAPTDSPPDAEPPAPPAPRWIVDRLPTVEDGNDDGDVAALMRPGLDGVYGCVTWQCVHPGTPWAPTNAIPGEPFDPTTLDRNGWIRSRLPQAGDIDRDGEVKVPKLPDVWTWFKASHVVPGQPWAPANSTPGEYQP